MIGVALEGGGAKGSYQAGAYIALLENGIKPDIITGTSIGSLNAAVMAQGDIDKVVNLWLNASTDIFGIDSEIIKKLKHKDFNFKDLKPTFHNIKEIIENKGIDASKYYDLIKNAVDEKKLRKSKIKFGLITVKMDGKPTPVQITIDDIPEGKVADYIMASCYLPLFKLKPIIDNNYYIDGGFYNNVPISLAQQYGCKTIYSIRIKGIGFNRNKIDKDTKIIEIKPRKNLGNIIIFDRESTENNIKLGYYDALKVIKNLDGLDYYFKSKKDNYYDKILKNIDDKLIVRLKFKYHAKTKKELLIKVMENILDDNKVNPYKIYNFKVILFKAKTKYRIKDPNAKKLIKNCKLI